MSDHTVWLGQIISQNGVIPARCGIGPEWTIYIRLQK